MKTRLILFFAVVILAFQPSAFAGGGDCVVDGTVHHVETTENKIILIVSGDCHIVNPKRDGYLSFPMDHGLFIIARREQPHSGDSDAWGALCRQAKQLKGKRATVASIANPDSISIERFEVFMVRCRVLAYPTETGVTPSVFLSESTPQ